MKLSDCPKRIAFCEWLLRFSRNNVAIFDQCFFSDEVWFQLDGYVNSQIYRIWSSENPHVYLESGLHPQKIGVWCALSRRRIVGPIFFETTVNSAVYVDLAQQFITLLEPDERYVYFQQDNAKAHIS